MSNSSQPQEYEVRLNEIVSRAKRDTRKHNYVAYEEYKEEVGRVAPTTPLYESTIRKVAKALKV